MDEKIAIIKVHILKGMPGRQILYKHSGRLHKFRIEGQIPIHWLYLSDELVDDSEAVVLINIINIYHVLDTFNQAENSKWLFLSSSGVEEVDETFAK